jgi:DUF971 family protein
LIPAPSQLRAHRDARVFEIAWPDGSAFRLPFHFVRCECPCAVCVDEITGVRLLDPAAVPAEIQPVQLAFSGNYALKVTWSDGHNTGLYTWSKLAELCRQKAAIAIAPGSAP